MQQYFFLYFIILLALSDFTKLHSATICKNFYVYGIANIKIATDMHSVGCEKILSKLMHVNKASESKHRLKQM